MMTAAGSPVNQRLLSGWRTCHERCNQVIRSDADDDGDRQKKGTVVFSSHQCCVRQKDDEGMSIGTRRLETMAVGPKLAGFVVLHCQHG
jgi:hypothetical protein